MHVDFLRTAKGGFFFHPSDEDQSLGTPGGKSHLRAVLPVYSNSETATEVEHAGFDC